MKKDTHIYIEYSISNMIERIAKKEHSKISDVYARLLTQALKEENNQANFELFNDNLNKVLSNTSHIKKMLKSVCSNLNIEDSTDYNYKRKIDD